MYSHLRAYFLFQFFPRPWPFPILPALLLNFACVQHAGSPVSLMHRPCSGWLWVAGALEREDVIGLCLFLSDHHLGALLSAMGWRPAKGGVCLGARKVAGWLNAEYIHHCVLITCVWLYYFSFMPPLPRTQGKGWTQCSYCPFGCTWHFCPAKQLVQLSLWACRNHELP